MNAGAENISVPGIIRLRFRFGQNASYLATADLCFFPNGLAAAAGRRKVLLLFHPVFSSQEWAVSWAKRVQMTWKLLIVDDHEVVRVGLSALLQAEDFHVVGTASTAEQACEVAKSKEPNVVLMDIRMAGTDGIQAMSLILETQPQIRFVMLSAYDNPTYIARAVAYGASDYVLKGSSHLQILHTLRRAMNSADAASDSLLQRVRRTMQQTAICKAGEDLPITLRELQVLRHIGLGLSNKEIARSLMISVETVKEHVQNILRKMNAADRTDAAVRAVKMGVV